VANDCQTLLSSFQYLSCAFSREKNAQKRRNGTLSLLAAPNSFESHKSQKAESIKRVNKVVCLGAAFIVLLM